MVKRTNDDESHVGVKHHYLRFAAELYGNKAIQVNQDAFADIGDAELDVEVFEADHEHAKGHMV
jgi:hypothetical protein